MIQIFCAAVTMTYYLNIYIFQVGVWCYIKLQLVIS